LTSVMRLASPSILACRHVWSTPEKQGRTQNQKSNFFGIYNFFPEKENL